MPAFGRRRPTSFEHVEKYPYGVVAPATVAKVEVSLRLPRWHRTHNQAQTQSCTGHGTAMERAITNARQGFLLSHIFPTKRYDPLDIWEHAKGLDEWADTNPGDNNGSSVNAAYAACRQFGLRPVRSMQVVADRPKPIGEKAADMQAGAQVTRWAKTIDEMRTAISNRQAVTIGTDWYSSMSTPIQIANGEWWLRATVGGSPDGHCTCIYGASDKRQAFRLKNSWEHWPEVWVPYSLMEKLLGDYGEAALVTDA
jgi:hypothetical protein